jgi:SAM-dependent methyltransferase
MYDWVSFWDSKHSVYVNARHLAAHYRRIADDLLRYLPAGGTVLDYGCGEALSHDRLAAVAGRLILCDAAPGVRAALASRFAGNGKIEVRAPGEIDALPAGELDLIVMHSVAQYLSVEQLDAMLVLFRRLLRPDGVLVLGDIIPPSVSPLTDALALLRFGAREGFFLAAVSGLVRTGFSNYARLRSALGLTHHGERAMLERLSAAGFRAQRAAQNIGHNPARMTFLARPGTAADPS